jgi:hypothetical protein
MVPVIRMGETGPAHPATAIDVGSTFTVTFVTEAFGVSTTGMTARLPAALVTLTDTQHFLPELNGSTIYHQLPSEFLPTICAVCPTFNALRATHAIPGPKRQFTATSFGDAMGTVGVNVRVGGGVFVGNGVPDGIGVEEGWASVAVKGGVGVDVGGALKGRLHASMDRTSTTLTKNGLYLMDGSSLFCELDSTPRS